MSHETGISCYGFCLNQSKHKFNLVKDENHIFSFLNPIYTLTTDEKTPNSNPKYQPLVCINRYEFSNTCSRCINVRKGVEVYLMEAENVNIGMKTIKQQSDKHFSVSSIEGCVRERLSEKTLER